MLTRAALLLLAITSGLLLCSCGTADPDGSLSDKEYATKINQWHKKRIDSLKAKDSWLSLAGLYKLREGVNTIGADSSNSIIFPPKAPSEVGTLTVSDSTFLFKANPNVTITRDEQKVSTRKLITDATGSPTILQHRSLRWYVIERRGEFYLRLKDSKHPNFASFNGIDRFPISQSWRVQATFSRFETPQTISIPDALGDVYRDSLYGRLEFTLNGQQYSLAPLGNPDTDDRFFIILGDQTNGKSTYSGGRYLYVSTPDKKSTTYIDFNKAYNPPCVFTRFATCPLPPARNKLNIKIEAGEKMYQPIDTR